MKSAYKSFNDLPLTLNATQVAEVLGISKVFAYNLLHQKTFPTIVIGKRMLVPKDKFVEWMNRSCEWTVHPAERRA